MSVQLLGLDGSAFSLTPVPDCWLREDDDGRRPVDLVLLDRSRQIRYLGRECDRGFVDQLSGWCFNAAAELWPERSVPAFQNGSVGVIVDVEQSDVGEVHLRVSVAIDPSDAVVGYDTVRVQTRRSSLVRASHQLRSWLDDDQRVSP